ncbi:TetR/AcrR family transcriptional regulator [Alkalibacillus aidingensis]|uniref:TetR/AcrR family transcriptional regulator n=1 Tax=Alkalibacillus aidingensis TaxID=2747607 RepID=UPI0016618262|nr:TetR-like C-terminal domain-containing protein [Alkalibacillus aidingensis]
MSDKLDRRKKYTRMMLKESLISLLTNQSISKITVKEICARADINRSTFYTHYHDQYDLLAKIEEEIIADLNNYLSSYNFTGEQESIQMTEKLIEYITSKKEIFQVLLNDHVDLTFEKRVMDVARQFLIKNWEEMVSFGYEQSEYLSTFVVSGAINVIKEWIEKDMDQSPKEMAEMINNFTNKGLSFLSN